MSLGAAVIAIARFLTARGFMGDWPATASGVVIVNALAAGRGQLRDEGNVAMRDVTYLTHTGATQTSATRFSRLIPWLGYHWGWIAVSNG